MRPSLGLKVPGGQGVQGDPLDVVCCPSLQGKQITEVSVND